MGGVMKNWNLTDADGPLTEVMLGALCCGPQRVTLDGEVDFVMLSVAEYARLTRNTMSPNGACAPQGDATGTAVPSVESTQSTSPTEADPDRKWVWEWDEETQRW